MKKLNFYLIAFFSMMLVLNASAQTAYNPFTQNIHFAPEPVASGFECGSTPSVVFTQGLTTSADATLWQTNPLIVSVCLSGFTFNGPASSVVSGTYASNFDWAFLPGSPNCIVGTQNQTLFGTGGNPIFPNPLSSGTMILSLKVPESSPVGTVLSVDVSLQVPSYMSFFNSVPDDNEFVQTQTFCNCYALTDPGTIGVNQSFCASGDPLPFTVVSAPGGGSGSTIVYQWQELIGGLWTDIAGATSSVFDAPFTTTTRQYRRNAKRSACGTWLNSNVLEITINALPIANAGSNQTTTCTTVSQTIGTVAISGNSYSWSPASGLSATNVAQPVANPIATTTYTVTVTGTNGCTSTSAVTVTVDKAPPVANAGANKTTTCSIPSVSIGTAAIVGNTYSWSPASGLSNAAIAQPTANPATTTTYTVTVTGTNGCTSTSTVTVTVDKASPVANAGSNQTTTCTTVSQTIGTVAISGNSYSWSPAAGLSATNVAQPVANPIATTTYTVTVTGANGCTATATVTVTVDKAPPVANAGANKTTTCSIPSVSIGTAAIVGNTYSWSPASGLSNAAIAQPTANPATTTTYTVTVTGTNGCTSTSTVTVTVDKASPVANAGSNQTTTCTTVSQTIGTVAISGNSYSWSPAAGLSATNVAQPVANPIATTTYTVTVTGANGCTATATVTVTVDKAPPVANAGSNQTTTCTVPSVTIGTTAITGNTYSWLPTAGLNNAAIAQPTANPAATTTYTVTVTGANGCTSTSTATVTVNKSSPVANAGSNQTTTCTTVSQAIGTVAISGNSYSWSPAAGLSATNVAQPVANPIATTTYTVTVTGANGCTATATVTVTVDKAPPVANAGSNQTTTCTVPSVTIGTTAITGNTYSWLPTAGLNNAAIAQPTANPAATTTYTVTVTGANGCTSTSTATVTVNKSSPVANAGSNQTTTCTTVSQTIGTVAISGNSYSWSPAAGLSATNVAQPVANPIATTTYTVTVTGANGCTATATVTVTVDKAPPVANAGANKTTTCSIPSVSIGTAAIVGNTYSWSPASGLSNAAIAQPTANPATTTTYTVTVTGTNGCTSTSTVTVTVDKASPVANAGSNQTTTCTTVSQTIGTVAISGNSYSWSPASGLSATNVAQPVANPIATTTYTVTVTGANGCTATATVTVTVDKAPPVANAGANKTTTCSIPSVSIGTAAIVGNTYSWSPASGLSNAAIAQPTANPATTTTYTVTVTGTNGCTSTSTLTVTVDKASPVANAGPNKTTTCTTVSQTIGTVAVSGNSYSWSPAAGLSATNIAQPVANPIATTTYTVTVTGTNGCTATATVTVTVNKTSPVVDAGSDKTTSCITPSVAIGTPAISGNTYLWVPASGLSATNIAQPVANPIATTVYTVTVTGTNGCTSTGTVTITVDKAPPVANAGSNQTTTCTTTSVTIGTVNISGNGYSWSPASGLSATNIAQPVANPIATTTYTVTVTGTNGCTATATVTVTVDKTSPVADAGGDKFLNCANPSAVIGSPAIIGNSYAWLPSTGLSSASIAQPTAAPAATTTYTVTVTGSNGCTSTDVVVVNINDSLPPFGTLYVCPGNTINLTSIEPAGYIGGVWTTSTGGSLSSTNVGAGTYNYTFTNGICVSTGSVTIILNIPDYTPTLAIAPSAITGISNVRVIATISEIENRVSCSDIYIFVPRLEPRFTFTYLPTATIVGGVAVNNSDWQLFTSNPNFYVWKYIGTAPFPAGGTSKFGYIGPYDPNNTDGVTGFSVQVFQGSGGEINFTNNTDSEILLYFR
jgi:hypothetical protein